MRRICALAANPLACAVGCFAIVAVALTGPALLGKASIGPDSVIDLDPLYDVTSPPPRPAVDDFTPIHLDLPRDLAFAHGLQSGRLDKWNPLAGCGAPLWAEQGGPFFPLKVPFYLAPSRRTYDVFLALRLVFAALGAYCLARRRGLALAPAVLAGATFEVSGALVAQLAFGASSPTCVLPWALLGSEAIATDRTPRAAVAAGVALGLAGNGGHPMLLLLVFVAFAAATSGHLAASWRAPRTLLSIAAWSMLAALIGLLLAAPSLLPLAELAQLGSSYKDRPIGAIVRTMALLRTRNTLPIAMFAPFVLQQIRGPIFSIHAFGPVVGTLGLVLGVTGIVRGALDASLAAVALLGLVLATAPPGLGWLHQAPGLRFVLPTYVWPLVSLPLTQACGAAVDALSSTKGRRAALAALGVVCAGFVLLSLVVDEEPFFLYATILRTALSEPGGWMRLVLPPISVLAVLVACFAMRHMRVARGQAVGVAVLVVLEELLVVAPLARERPSTVLAAPPSPAVRFLQVALASGDGRIVGVPYTLGHPLTPMLFGLPDIRGVSALPVRRLQLYREAIHAGSRDFTIQDIPVTRSPLLDLAAVRYVIVPRVPQPPPFLEGDAEMPIAHRGRQVLIYENRAALPRARIAHSATPVRDEHAAELWAQGIGRSTAHARALGLADSVILEPDESGHDPPRLSGSGSRGESVRIVDQQAPDRLVLEARLDSPGLVVIADTYYPGWRAWVDGSPSPVFPADLLFRAVPVPAGTHRVLLRYEPRSFRDGVRALLAGCLLCAALAVPRRPNAAAHGTGGTSDARRLSSM